VIRRINMNPVLTWTGPTSGSQDLFANQTIDWTALGTYTFTVNRNVILNLTAAGSGASGESVGGSADGGDGGASGAWGTASGVLFQSGVTYEAYVSTANDGLASYVAIQGGAKSIEMGSGMGRSTPGTVITGVGVAGANGGLGGAYASVGPGGAHGSINVGGAGAGGGGGTQGSTVLGGGGNGGGLTNGSSDHGSVPGQGDPGGQGLPVTVAGSSCSAGGGGGFSGDTGSGGASSGYNGAVQLVLA
jgi:hypothetical protein